MLKIYKNFGLKTKKQKNKNLLTFFPQPINKQNNLLFH